MAFLVCASFAAQCSHHIITTSSFALYRKYRSCIESRELAEDVADIFVLAVTLAGGAEKKMDISHTEELVYQI